MSERKGLTLPSTPFSAGNSDTMPSSTAPCCTSSAVLSGPAQSLTGRLPSGRGHRMTRG